MKEPTGVADLSGKVDNSITYSEAVRGIDFEESDGTLDSFLKYCGTTGFQATNLIKAIKEVRRMENANVKVFFGCTSNIISSGMREQVRFMAKNKKFDVMVCTGGGIEEDLIKCLAPTYISDFNANGKALRENGWNRIGNLAINNNNYVLFEEWITAVLDELVSGKAEGFERSTEYTPESPLIITPSAFIRHLGKKIDSEESVLYWCLKNNINVYSPALTDGSIGDMLTFYSRRSCLKLDIVEDIYNMNTEALGGHKNGGIVVGCGLVKHHILNASLFNNGLDYCVLINTASEYDGSDSGATLNEAYSWGKVKPTRTGVKVHGEASVLFPLLVYGAYKSSLNYDDKE